MKPTPTQNQLAGRATGSLFFAAFGALWLTLSLFARQIVHVETVASVLLGLSLLLAACATLFRESKRWPRLPEDPNVDRVFVWVNVIQWIAGGIVAFTLARLHLDAYIPSAITAIVGLHMLPLARLFRYPLHYATGGLLVAWAATSALFVPTAQLQGIAAFGTGILLWLSAAVTLVAAMRSARQPAPSAARPISSPRQGSAARAS